MRKISSLILLLILLLLSSSIAFAADKSQIADSLKKLVNNQLSPIVESYNVPTNFNILYRDKDESLSAAFYKSTEIIGNYSIHIQKATSLLSPYTGCVEYDKTVIFGDDFATHDQALTDKSELSRMVTSYRLNYAYRNNEWVLINIEDKLNLPNMPSWTDHEDSLEDLKCKTKGM